MAMAPGSGQATSTADGGTHIDAPELRLFVMALFFIFGGITSLNTDTIGQFSLPTAVYDPLTGEYIADLNGQTLPPGIPEPATWAMVIFGFGVLGAGLRRIRNRAPETV